MIKDIVVKVIKHKDQRYETVGDWVFNPDNGRLSIWVSDMGVWEYNFLVAMHEQWEAMLCVKRGIEEKDVTAFDVWYEHQRKIKNSECQAEPGDHKLAPYRKEHFSATTAERMLAAELNVNWEEYDTAVNAL